MKNDYKKYLITSNKDKSWGFYVNNLGRNVIGKYAEYPSMDHPDQYIFTWDKGRVLDEFHLVLITKGEGVFESNATGKIKVSDGDVFLLFPDVWHRYKPKKSTGWTERWVGFSGAIANQFLSNGFFNADEPIVSKCNIPSVLHHFNTLFKLFDKAIQSARNLNVAFKAGNVLSSDLFYTDHPNAHELWAAYNVLCVEMETAGLYSIAAKHHVDALAILTISDSLVTGEKTTSEERETTFNQMITIALNIAN